MSPRVSVIMNTFNSARLLQETLESLRGQTFGDWELIIWDNRSTDNTMDIAAGFRDPRARLFVAPSAMTLAEGRNHAMAAATGEWLAYLDHDDIWLPHKLQAQIALIDACADPESLGLVYARTQSFSSRGDEGEMIYRYIGRPLPEGRIIKVLLEEGCIIPLVSAMVRRSAWERVGIIPGHLRFAEDYWLFIAVAEHYEVRCVQEVCCRYRVHPESATAKYKALSHIESLEILESWKSHLPPARYRRRRRVCHTLWGVEIILREKRVLAGMRKILLEGSLLFLMRGCVSFTLRNYVLGRRPVS
jgi:hypothetical protein